MAKSKRTPNQKLYQKQRQRLRRIEREYQQKLGVTNISSVVPEMRDRVTKRDIERLRKITPEKFREEVFKNVQQYVPEVDKPVKVYQYKPRKPLTERQKLQRRLKRAENKLDRIKDYRSNEYSEASSEYSKAYDDLQEYEDEIQRPVSQHSDYFTPQPITPKEEQETIEPEHEPLPEPPHTNPFYDSETGLWIDLNTGEILDPETKEPIEGEDYPDYDDIVLSNVTSTLDDATNTGVAGVIYKALNEEIVNVGREEVAKRLENAGFYAVDLALEVAEDSKGEKIKSNAVELLTLIRGGALTANDQFRLNDGLLNDRQSWNEFFGYQDSTRSRSGRRKR